MGENKNKNKNKNLVQEKGPKSNTMYTNRLQPLPIAVRVSPKLETRETEFEFFVIDNVIPLGCKEKPCA